MSPKGWRTRYENELARRLWEAGFVVCRCPASGGSRKSYPCLDLFAWSPRTGELIAVEVKSSSKCSDSECLKRMLTESEAGKVAELLKRGVRVFVALRYKGRWLWFLFEAKGEGEWELNRADPPVFA